MSPQSQLSSGTQVTSGWAEATLLAALVHFLKKRSKVLNYIALGFQARHANSMIQAPSQCSQEITSREGPETNPIYCQITENFDTMVHPEVRSGGDKIQRIGLGQFMKTSGPQIPSPPQRGGGTSHSQLGK